MCPGNEWPYVLQYPEYYKISSREGYVFKYWNTKADGQGKAINPKGSVYSDDLVYSKSDGEYCLYAIWEKE
jgi:hypothetical protein